MQGYFDIRGKINSNLESSSPTCSPSLRRRSHLKVKKTLKQHQSCGKLEKSHLSDDDSDDSSFYGEETMVRSSDASTNSNLVELSLNSSTKKTQTTLPHENKVLSNYSHFIYAALIFLAIIASFRIIVNSFSHTPVEEPMIQPPNLDLLKQTEQLVKQMSNYFPAQETRTWISFISALSSVIQENPSQPAVLLLVGENTVEAIHTLQCIARQLALITNKLFSITNLYDGNLRKIELTVNVDEVATLFKNREEPMKKELDTRIRSILNQSHSVIFGPLEDLPPRAALLLHGYCDNFMAPFKDRVIILTATFDSNERPINSKQIDRRLHTLWNADLGKDKAGSLISRVANNPVFIEPESGSIPCKNDRSI